MYLPKSKYKPGYSKPGMYSLKGKEYIGPCFTDYLGNTYEGSDPSNMGERLNPLDTCELGTSITPVRKPTQEEYSTGSMDRYFKQDKRNLKISELSIKDWSGSLDVEQPRYLLYTTASWILTGSLDDIKFGEYSYKGVRKRNQETLEYLETQFQGITGSLTLSPEDYVVENWKPGISGSKLKVQ